VGGRPGGGVPDRPWTWLDQRHGADVVEVTRAGEHAGTPADAAVTAAPGVALVVRTADCAPVALLAPEAVGIAHAGWRGLTLGVVEAAVAALRRLGVSTIEARVGPCISAARYEFGASELDEVAARYGDGVRAVTAEGRPALDLAAGVVAALAGVGIDQVSVDGSCTATAGDRYFSLRDRRDQGRQGSFVWLGAAGSGAGKLR
jgi:YfiH family protein